MANPNQASSLFTQVDIAPTTSQTEPATRQAGLGGEHAELLRQVLASQDRQNELLEELVNLLGAAHRQRQNELGQWRKANPKLARACRKAAETLSKVQVEFLERLTDEVAESAEVLVDGEFMLNEFVDRFGPRMAHLNGVLQVLSQLAPPNGSRP